MNNPEIINVYFPPQEVEANIVGTVEVVETEAERLIRASFLGQPFDRDRIVKGRFLLDERAQRVARRMAKKMLFQAEAQLGYPASADQQDFVAL